MKSIKTLLLPLLIFFALGAFTAYAQTPIVVSTTINLSEYDVIFLTDFFDVKADKLSSAAPGFSVRIDGIPNEPIYLKVQAVAQLRGGNGDAGNDPLVSGCTADIRTATGSLFLTARDFAKGGIAALIPSRCGYSENTALKKKIRDMALVTSTAPPGTYQLLIDVFLISTGRQIAGDSRTINVTYSAASEIFVEINEPKTGSIINSLNPTFTWTCTEPNVTVRVFEAGLNHRSPQDALTGGNPYLEQVVKGTNTLTYPANARRQLQEGKAYVVQVEANVSTTRGALKSISEPVVFRIANDNLGKMLDNFMNTVPGNASSAYSTLRGEPAKWIPLVPFLGNMTLDGNMLSEGDLQLLLNQLSTQHDLKLDLSVENQ
ncbi:MAG: hypothetical protein JXA06_13370 [Bacteroidetes bacterium]|nr:hypothetical protein [Bacteroidota bacterium]